LFHPYHPQLLGRGHHPFSAEDEPDGDIPEQFGIRYENSLSRPATG